MPYRDHKKLSDDQAMKWDGLYNAAEDLALCGELLGSAVGHVPWLILVQNYEHLNADDMVSMACGMGALFLGLGASQ